MDESVLELLVQGLMIDGAHHKQWYLERTLEALVGGKEFNKIKHGIIGQAWESGIAP